MDLEDVGRFLEDHWIELVFFIPYLVMLAFSIAFDSLWPIAGFSALETFFLMYMFKRMFVKPHQKREK